VCVVVPNRSWLSTEGESPALCCISREVRSWCYACIYGCSPGGLGELPSTAFNLGQRWAEQHVERGGTGLCVRGSSKPGSNRELRLATCLVRQCQWRQPSWAEGQSLGRSQQASLFHLSRGFTSTASRCPRLMFSWTS